MDDPPVVLPERSGDLPHEDGRLFPPEGRNELRNTVTPSLTMNVTTNVTMQRKRDATT